jgi:hypothetical protein
LLQKNPAVQNKPLFINNKQTPEFQENFASFSSVQCSSWPFNSQFGCFLVVAMLVWFCTAGFFCNKIIETDWAFFQFIYRGIDHDHLMFYHNL